MTLRILHVVCTDEFAGVEQFILRLAVAQAEVGHTVAVAGGSPDRMRPALASAGIAFTAAASVAQAARAIRASEVDVVNSHMTAADTATILATTGARGRRPARVSTRHFAQRRGRLRSLDPMIAPRMDAEISISAWVASRIGLPSTVVHPGIPSRPDVDPSTRRRTILMAQRLEAEKHTATGIRAFAASELASQGWTLAIAGDGKERSSLETLTRALDLRASVEFLGLRRDVPRLMSAAGILLATAPSEHFGLTVLEAMGSGLPIVATDAGGHREMLAGLDERTLYPPDDWSSAAHALRAFADDASGRARVGAMERVRQRESFGIDAQAVATEAVYSRALLARRAG